MNLQRLRPGLLGIAPPGAVHALRAMRVRCAKCGQSDRYPRACDAQWAVDTDPASPTAANYYCHGCARGLQDAPLAAPETGPSA